MCDIPCSDPHRKRSAEILDEVAARFGYPTTFTEGGIADEIESWLKDDNS
ncbi:hypothetical protein [Rhodococcus sp. PvP104]|nr:hypothetical protein [Rhodococcus sp. PvP104]MBP2522271.1 hypothetical protein [Rhodococcus sp. PvP104]